MKVVYLSTAGHLGGTERNLLDLLSSLRQLEPGWQLELIAGSDGPLLSEVRRLGVPHTVLPFPVRLARLGDAAAGGPAGNQVNRLDLLKNCLLAAPGVMAYITRLRQLLAAAAPDIIHTSGFKMHVLGSRSRPKGSRVIWHVQDYVRPRPVMATLLRCHGSRCAAAVTNSRSVAADLRMNCGSGFETYPVYNGIDLDRFVPDGPALDLDALCGMPPAQPGTIRVGLVGTFSRWKGHMVFLDALARLPDPVPVRGYVIGGNVYQTVGSEFRLEELRGCAQRLGIADRVGFTGFVRDTAAAMRSLDVVVHASTEPEPFGLVIAEAMACGKAVIVAESGGAVELVSPEENALGHPPGLAGILSAQMLRLASNPVLRAKLGAAAHLAARRSFDRKRMAAELVPIYREVCAAGGGRQAAGEGSTRYGREVTGDRPIS